MRRAVILFPSGLTLGNLFFGIFAIIAASRKDFVEAGVYVLLGGAYAHAYTNIVQCGMMVVVAIALFVSGLHHFDAHLDNILTDGERLYFVDLALAMSPRFDLSASEVRFLDANLHVCESRDVLCHGIVE